MPETKGISLEEMDMLFMRPMHKAVWGQLRGKPILNEEEVIAREKGFDEKQDVERVEVVQGKR